MSRDDAPVSGEGTATIAVRRADGGREVCVNRLGFTLLPPAPGVTVGNLAGTSAATVPADTPQSRRFLAGVAAELARQHRANVVRPVPKPRPARTHRRWEEPVPCPACVGDDPFCDLCGGTGATTPAMAERWRARHQD